MKPVLDILFVADARFEGGTSTAIAVEMRAAARAGLRVGLLMVKGPLLRHPFPVHPEIRALIDTGLVQRVDPAMAIGVRLVLIHHPTIMANRPTRPLRVDADIVVLVLHHPMFDGSGKRQYDLATNVRHCFEAFGRPVHVAAVSVVVRDSLTVKLPGFATVLKEDWTNVIDIDLWPARPLRQLGKRVVIGRHSRPDALKWPSRDDAMLAYPADSTLYDVRILGAGDYLTELYETLPPNWTCLPFSWTGVPEFLASLDFYVYYHDDRWSEAFGRTILEALTVGLVVILPAHFERIFGDAALYGPPDSVQALIQQYVADPSLYAEQSARARRFAEETCSDQAYAGRIERLIERLGPKNVAASDALADSTFPPLPVRTIVFASSNGIGVGHLTQQLAIATRLPVDLRSVFATMSYSMRAVVDEGYQAHFLTYHRHLQADPGDWNNVLSEELFDLLRHLRPAIFAYDATAVFSGVVDALAMCPDIFSVWVRRPMWRESHRPFLDLAEHFDAVIEPGELARDFDHGPTAELRDKVLLVPPVLHIDPAERMSRKAARAALNLPDSMTVVALQLGSGANFDMETVRAGVIAAVLEHPDTLLLDIRSPIAPDAVPETGLHPRHRIITLFPSYRYSRAFDAAVTAAGYNAFHEQVLGAIPTLFVPNEADEMDLQVNRARWAELSGRGWLMRRDFDLAHVRDYVARLLDPAERARVVARCGTISWTNGARDIARYFEDHARLVRTDWDITRDAT
ncbi:glycosyltransferase [Pararhizobium sp.]|uniref:glycosyltransferase n=1 Tax=Pararhizobium sp. TaxID=1977563 RepID=UPI002715E42F|nr:glycosyltransferase [Pararhizobium sp.]MDO9416197.1 glycosyltransferase [Pararhizobium sp.]